MSLSNLSEKMTSCVVPRIRFGFNWTIEREDCLLFFELKYALLNLGYKFELIRLVFIQVDVKIESHSIVVVGDLNPSILQPYWFFHNNLIRESEAEKAKIKILHRDISIVEFDWFIFNVTREKFTITTTKEAFYPLLRDLAIGTFSILSHTPITALGINMQYHINYGKESLKLPDGRSVILEGMVAPIEIWDNLMQNPTVESFVISENRNEESFPGKRRLKIESSQLVTRSYV